MEPVGQTSTQAVQKRQLACFRESPSMTTISRPFTFSNLMAPTPRSSVQARTQRPQRMQRYISWRMMGFSVLALTLMLLARSLRPVSPTYWLMEASWHLPNLGQPVHSAGWVLNMKSQLSLRMRSAVSSWVLMTMPS